MDWVQFAYLAAGLVGGALAKHFTSGAKPVVDPNNQRPLVDSVRDAVRAEIVAIFGGSSLPQLPKPSDQVPLVPLDPKTVDVNALLHKLIDKIAPPSSVPPAAAVDKPAA